MGQTSKGNSVYRHTAFKIKPNANITYNQKQIPGSTCTLGRWRFYFCSHRSQNYFPASPCYFVFVFFLRLFTHSQCIHNWPVTQEISNYFKFCRVWPVRWCMLHGRPCLELLGFWRLQESSTEVTSKFRSSRLPWWRLTSHTLFIRHAYSRFSLTWENRNKNGNLLIKKV